MSTHKNTHSHQLSKNRLVCGKTMNYQSSVHNILDIYFLTEIIEITIKLKHSKPTLNFDQKKNVWQKYKNVLVTERELITICIRMSNVLCFIFLPAPKKKKQNHIRQRHKLVDAVAFFLLNLLKFRLKFPLGREQKFVFSEEKKKFTLTQLAQLIDYHWK